MNRPILATIWNAAKAAGNWTKRRTLTLAGLLATVFVFVMGPTILFNVSTAGSRYNAMDNKWTDMVPDEAYAIVLGAGVTPDGKPTPYLKWRVETAADLYKAGKVHTIVMSGDNSDAHYNEPEVMGKYALGLGVQQHDIVLDYAGFNTYDTCYRAKYIFGISRAAVISQGYHVPRAVATCNKLGVQSIGVAAKHASRDYTLPYLVREVLSSDKAFVQLILKPQPTVAGNPQYITHGQ